MNAQHSLRAFILACLQGASDVVLFIAVGFFFNGFTI